tara:strand:- start:596 stop:769 length:174 start_codon:yes stop_codon:yes gene_type:complete
MRPYIIKTLRERVEALEAELVAVDFALDGKDAEEYADLKEARLKVYAARSAVREANK